MKKNKVLDRGMIEEFAVKIDDQNARKVYYLISEYIDDITESISLTNPLVNVQNVEFLVQGDLLTNSFLTISEPEFFLSIRSPQIELNSIGPMENRFKLAWARFKTAWANRNKNSVRFQKKQKKKREKKNSEITEKQLLETKEKPYSLVDLKNDYFESLTGKMTNLTILYNSPTNIRILGKDEFGFRINIYPVLKHDDFFRIWNPYLSKFIETYPDKAKQLLEEKSSQISKLNLFSEVDEDLLYKIIRVYKNLFFSLCHSYNYQFVESLIYACPNSLFKTNCKEHYVYDVFLKVLNYLNNIPLNEIRSIYNEDKSLVKQHNVSIFQIKNFLKDINNYLS